MILLGITLVLAIVTTCVLPALAGLQEGLDAFLRGDHKVAIEEWRPLAEQGDDVAQFNMGAVYDQGQGVKRDPIEASRFQCMSGNRNGNRWRVVHDQAVNRRMGCGHESIHSTSVPSPSPPFRWI